MTPLRFLGASMIGSGLLAWFTYPLMERLGFFPRASAPVTDLSTDPECDDDLSPFGPPASSPDVPEHAPTTPFAGD